MSTENTRLPELLAPCGSPDAIRAAILGGADAVYFGGTMFNARMNAKNLRREAIKEAVELCHENGVRAYVTLNTLVLDRETESALEYVAFLYESGVDALIITDIGFADFIHRNIPEFELHASTQMTAHNAEAAKLLHNSGFSRMVCAREMSASQIVELVKSSPIEIEAFIHGAICVSCSGQCLMSAMLGGRSGNRGECAQPCRMPYNGSYPLSLKDMCLARHVPELIDSGIASLKIEGRMKSPDYVYGVTRIYRRLLDERRAATDREVRELAELFSRGGFTDGYFVGKKDASMLGTRSERDIADSRSHSAEQKPARAKPLPKIEINERSAPVLEAPKRRRGSALACKPINSAVFTSAKQLPDTDYFDIAYLPLSAYDQRANGVALPTVIYDDELDDVLHRLDAAKSSGAEHLLISNISHIELARRFELIPHADMRMNVFNSLSAEVLAEKLDIKSIILSPELNLPQMRDVAIPRGIKKGAVVYGRLPLMLLEKPIGTNQLRDRKGARFPVLHRDGHDFVYNSVPIYMADQIKKIDDAGIAERHFVFSLEDRGEVLRTIYAYTRKLPPKEHDLIRRIK